MKFPQTLTRILAGALLAALAMTSASTWAAKGIIKLHEGDWTGNLINLNLAKIILEEEMDYKTKVLFLPAGPQVYEAILGGDIDVAFEFWPSYNPTKGEYFTKWGGDGSLEYLGEMGIIGASGWYVPRYVIEGDASRGIDPIAPDLKTYADLNKYKEVFAAPETAPRGRLVACPVAAWQCQDKERAEGLGVDFETVELGSEMAHWAELEGAYARGDAILIYSWEPHWTHAKYDMVEIELPEYSDDAYPVSDYPTDITFNLGSTTLKDRYPDVHQFILNLNLTNKQQSEMILEVDVNKKKLEDVVREWMASNEDVWKAWLP